MHVSLARRSNALASAALLLVLTCGGVAMRAAGAASRPPQTIGASAFT